MPATSSTKPSAPASTTLARRSISSFSGVASSDTRAAASALRNSSRKSSAPACAAAAAAPAKSAITVRIVPSRGSASDSRAYVAPAAMASANWAVVRAASVAARSPTPSRNCARIAPELPRAPSSAASATRVRSWPACGSGPVAQRCEHGLQRQREVGAGVAVGHREHVDLVDHFLARDEAVDAGAQRGGELRAVEREDGRNGRVHRRSAARAEAGGSAGRGRRGRRPRG